MSFKTQQYPQTKKDASLSLLGCQPQILKEEILVSRYQLGSHSAFGGSFFKKKFGHK
jgi:hypothetical protein